MDSRVSTIVEHLEGLGFPFEAADNCPWLEAVEASFGLQLPEPYRSLIQAYRFPEFDVPGFEAFSNLGDGSGYDISHAPFQDPGLCEWLLPRRYLQIGRPEFANYDPICFDMKSSKQTPQIVRIDHEDILLCRKHVNVRVVSESFVSLVFAGVA
ncbi:SMI1/KNR4 family protein [Lysobacter sp. CFH 32150]|uniref:SMI1/KNR4 family protein n=1 Tax=Lysobacter sp. CFH 32150 TaxID=2927128 RepID=UPI001FA7EDEC|nr:SMI1/KNR4 family protein [Lysobacter sp. CFH 32150]MCI4569045.1 SMI1/KNR4 family protein [Lysobacter sp. CFH 32150]